MWNRLFSNPRSGPWSSSGASRYGASMGRSSDHPSEFVGRAQLQRVPMTGQGDYDAGGAYWGAARYDHRAGRWITPPLYAAWDDEGHQIFLRAATRADAKRELEAKGIRFKR